MSVVAHLVLWMDVTSVDKPAVASAGIYSEARPTTRANSALRPISILHMTGRDFSEAKNALLTLLRTDSLYAWVLPLLAKVTAS